MYSGTRLLIAMIAIVPSIAALGAPVSLRTGASSAVDGYLEIVPDEYGSWAQPFATGGFGPNADQYNPIAGFQLRAVAFSSGFFLFTPNGQRELLSDNVDWQGVADGMGGPPFSDDMSLTRTVTSPNVASDTNGDGIDDTATSAFSVSGTGTDLAFTLQQRVAIFSGAVSFMQQTYGITNNGAEPIDLTLVRAFDGDLIFTSTSVANDQVGTTANGAGLGQYVFIQEPLNPALAITLSGGADGRFYYGGKDNFTPPNGGPPYDFGTDTEVWDAMGVPLSWQNNIATVGYNTNGVSGTVAGALDAFIGLDFAFSLDPGASVSFDVFHTYGQATPVPEPSSVMLLLGCLTLLRRRR